MAQCRRCRPAPSSVNLLLTLLAVAPSWSVTTTVDLQARTTNVSAELVELDEVGQPIWMRLECQRGQPDFQFAWHDHSGPGLMVIEVGEGDQDLRKYVFRRDVDNTTVYHLADNISSFMARFVTYEKPTLLAHFTDGSRLWTFATSETREAWLSVSAACRS